ncbi:MAG: argininosuccinate lyase [Bacilli bacterium]|nr:argininosuccinate lyase [Bacilli bacterium]MBR3209418.1 argininosuccinate lyase [Bacilli bacterium]
MAMWDGRFKKVIDERTNDFNSSIKIDKRLYKYDIMGSLAHAKMLYEQKIISHDDFNLIDKNLKDIYADINSGSLKFDLKSEDVHMFIEKELTDRCGDVGKKLHTARSRNDQVTTDFRLYLRDESKNIISLLKDLIKTFCDISLDSLDTIMPGYTHLQRAQPITFAHHLMAYSEMFLGDIDRLNDSIKRINVSPLGCCTLAGTSHNIDGFFTSHELGFDRPCNNSLDGVSDRDYVIEFNSNLSIIMVHLSRLCEELVMWCSWEFKFIELDDAFSTGSSIMPQKKNPDIPELIRGKSGRIFSNLFAMLTVMNGLPLSYNKDMQEDKEHTFDSIDNTIVCLQALIPMLKTMTILKDNMLNASKKGFLNATDVADYLCRKGLPFRDAYKITGKIVAYSIDNDKCLDELSVDEFKSFSNLFDSDIYKYIDLFECVKNRKSYGGPNPDLVKKHILNVLDIIK